MKNHLLTIALFLFGTPLFAQSTISVANNNALTIETRELKVTGGSLWFRNNPVLGIGAVSSENTFIGLNSGLGTVTSSGTGNVFIGEDAGRSNTTGGSNVFVGRDAGNGSTVGNNNTFLGNSAGSGSTGSGNVFIGHRAGNGFTTGSNLLINNTDTGLPLIRGKFSTTGAATLIISGKTGINGSSTTQFAFPTNTAYNGYGLFVKGGIYTQEITVVPVWADYVFDDSYKLKSLEEVEKYILENNHLPNVPSATIVESQGMNVGDMARIQQEKIEELTLYLIEMNKKTEAMNRQMVKMQETIDVLSSGKIK